MKLLILIGDSAVGKMTVSEPRAEMTGSAIVREHLPRHEISCIVKTLFIIKLLLHLMRISAIRQ